MKLAGAINVAKAIDEFQALRLRHMQSLRAWSKFGRGWQRRVNEVTKLAKQLDAGQDDFDWLESIGRVEGKAEGASKNLLRILQRTQAQSAVRVVFNNTDGNINVANGTDWVTYSATVT